MKSILVLLFSLGLCLGETVTFTMASGEIIKNGQIISVDQKTILLLTPTGPREIFQHEVPPKIREQASKYRSDLETNLLTEAKFLDSLQQIQLAPKATAKEMERALAYIEKLRQFRSEIASLEQKLALAKVGQAVAFGRLSESQSSKQIRSVKQRFSQLDQEREHAVIQKKNELTKVLLHQIEQRESAITKEFLKLSSLQKPVARPVKSPHAKK